LLGRSWTAQLENITMGALPNLFEFVIAEALEDPDATPESVATAIASSEPFLKAVRLGLAHVAPPGEVSTTAQITRTTLAKAFSSPTAGTMF
jgi:hypothetical protein